MQTEPPQQNRKNIFLRRSRTGIVYLLAATRPDFIYKRTSLVVERKALTTTMDGRTAEEQIHANCASFHGALVKIIH